MLFNCLIFKASLKRPLFHINFDPVDCKVEKISKKSKICDLSENLKHWEELVSAGPSTHMGFLCSKTKLKSKTSTRVPQEKLQERYRQITLFYAFYAITL